MSRPLVKRSKSTLALAVGYKRRTQVLDFRIRLDRSEVEIATVGLGELLRSLSITPEACIKAYKNESRDK